MTTLPHSLSLDDEVHHRGCQKGCGEGVTWHVPQAPWYVEDVLQLLRANLDQEGLAEQGSAAERWSSGRGR